MSIDKIPILKALKNYKDEETVPFHMPGHKKGNIYRKTGFDFLDNSFLAYDVTEVEGIDNLHCPESSIQKAQQIAAEVFGAKHTFFLVNGTTSGIYSMILAATEPGDEIIIPRNCHKSVINAVIMGRLKPIYLQPEVDDSFGTAMGIAVEALDKLLKKHPKAKAVVVTNPTYYGVCSDIKSIADLVHVHDKLLLVDEAHGSHFKFNDKLPTCALEAGADAAAQSTHKTLPAMTQSSMLHINSKKIDIEKVRFFLQLTQSTSPSHILLASLDAARFLMQEKGEMLLDEIIDWSRQARKEINKIDGLHCLDRSIIGKKAVYDIDETRLTINVRGLGITGSQADDILRKDFNIQMEMSDLYNLVAITTVGDEKSSYEKLVEALRQISKSHSIKHEAALYKSSYDLMLNSEQAMLPWEAVYKQKELVDFKQSIDRISGDMIIPYPPGIPVIMPGEIITKELLDYLTECKANNLKLNGLTDITLNELSIINNL